MIVGGLLAGAIPGLLSTVLMVLFEIPFWKKWGFNQLIEWQLNWALFSRLAWGNPITRSRLKVPLTVAGHLFHGVISGIVFSLVLPMELLLFGQGSSILLEAVAYSAVLWIIFSLLLARQYQTRLGFRSSKRGLLVALLSHLVYGTFLGLIISIA